ncbi:histone-lysine N-methyltransferase SETMAR-like [Octopus bimaculoides]|uniref:histone-lysine N-methyltransferase SETMAR-like n=1 Tax=Octopus bimaculoides TaxID=37653 RepID=UPI0022E2280B|nr:histone-lysine N-methyltransferase SETMAR-like [Octopus bimaculoides]
MCQENEKFFGRLIIQDETWIPHNDSETEAQSKKWKHDNSPPSKEAHIQFSAGKVMLTVLWDQRGVVMMGFLAKGTRINRAYDACLLQKLRDVIKAERRGMFTKGVSHLQDNTSVHNAHVALMKAHSCVYENILHPSHSPDLAQSDFHLFPIMKSFFEEEALFRR